MAQLIDSQKALGGGPETPLLPRMSFDAFWNFCQRNPDQQVELNAQGELIFMSPTGGTTGNRNVKILRFLDEWADEDATGLAFDSSMLFRLPNGAVRSPDAAWIRLDRWNSLTPQQQDEPAPLAPDFVVELLSPSDRLVAADRKMQEYLANGVRLALLIDRKNRRIHVYRPHQDVIVEDDPAEFSGDPELPGFRLPTQRIF
jgi:Uma2 family endonuclease